MSNELQNKVFDRFISTFGRIHNWKSSDIDDNMMYIDKFIYQYIYDKPYTAQEAKYLIANRVISLLNDEEIIYRTIIITALLEASKTLKEFEELYELRKEHLKFEMVIDQSVDLDEILKKILEKHK